MVFDGNVSINKEDYRLEDNALVFQAKFWDIKAALITLGENNELIAASSYV